MKNKIFVALAVAFCMVLGGCGDKSDLTVSDDAYETEDGSLDAEDDSEEGELIDNELGTSESEVAEPAETKGIIAMVRRTEISVSGGQTDVQIVSIDPETGVQSIVSEFHLDHITYAELQRAKEVDDTTEFYYAQPEEFSVYGNNRDWFSDDLTKMKVTRTYPANSSKSHAGWVDSDGMFFDITEAIGAAEDESFSSHTASHRSMGFTDGRFAFYEYGGDNDNYYVPLDNISDGSFYEADEEDWYVNLSGRQNNGSLHPTCKIDDNTYIMDIATSGANCPNSVIVDITSDEITHYLPDSERYNWSGTLSPNGEMVAFLSTKNGGNEAIELYAVPLAGGEPEKISVVPNGDLLADITTLVGNDLPITDNMNFQYHYALIGWR